MILRIFRLLYTDPTTGALQVFLRKTGLLQPIKDDLPREQGSAEGIWINADPIPGCIVCNIGESESFSTSPIT